MQFNTAGLGIWDMVFCMGIISVFSTMGLLAGENAAFLQPEPPGRGFNLYVTTRGLRERPLLSKTRGSIRSAVRRENCCGRQKRSSIVPTPLGKILSMSSSSIGHSSYPKTVFMRVSITMIVRLLDMASCPVVRLANIMRNIYQQTSIYRALMNNFIC